MKLQLLVVVFGSLLFATVAIEFLRRFRPGAEIESVFLRLRTWWWISISLTLTLEAGNWAIYTLVTLIFIQSSRELLLLPMESLKGRILTAIYGMILLPFGLMSVALIGKTEAPPVLLAVFFLTALNDIFQYIFGKAFGQRKLAPNISPNKTWEGFWGGVLMTTVVAFFLPLVESAALGAAIACMGTLGDLCVSHLKRQAAVKDTGSFLPGHGGLLDRLDSLILVAPFVLFWGQFNS
jgi:phosphatidate cytidylyltransferase